MSASQRRKGAHGERELVNLLRDRLGDLPGLCRNLEQSRSGGADILLPGYAIEVKRAERFLSAWIEQAEREAGDCLPVVAWRRNGKPWRCLLVLDVDQFAEAVRGRLPGTMQRRLNHGGYENEADAKHLSARAGQAPPHAV